jgi:hypothetical protein
MLCGILPDDVFDSLGRKSRSHKELPKAQHALHTHPQPRFVDGIHIRHDEDRKALIADVVRYSSRRRIRASAVRILAAVLERADPAILEEKSAPQKTALRLFAEPEAYRMMIAEAGQNACQPLAMSDSLSAIQKRLQHCDIQSLTNPVNEDASNFGEHYGFGKFCIQFGLGWQANQMRSNCMQNLPKP